METAQNRGVSVDIQQDIMITIEEDPITVKHKIFKRFPWFLFSWTIVLIFIFVYVDNSNYAYGCKNDMFQWRLMTYHMFHLNIQHIVFNVLAFWLFGLYIHMTYNDFVNVIIYVIGIIVSGCTYYIDCKHEQSKTKIIGSSGGVCAIVGAVFVIAVFRFGKGIYELGKVHYAILKYMLSFTTIFSVLGLVLYDIILYLTQNDGSISHIAHFGGYISGAFVGVLIITVDTYMCKK